MNTVIDSIENYWLQQLKDAPALNLPVFPVEGDGVHPVDVPVSSEDVQAIRKIAGGKDFNVLKLFLGGLSILLWKYSGQHDIVVATPPLQMPGSAVKGTGTLYCRLLLEENVTVQDLLRQVHETLNRAYQNSEYNERLFKSRFAAQKDADPAAIKGVGFKYGNINIDGDWLNEHLLVFEFIEGDESCIRVSCGQPLFPEKMLRNMAASLLSLVKGLPENKSQSVAACAVVSESERLEWERRFENNKRDYRTDVTVIDLFAKSVELQLAKPALVFGEESMSYAELDAFSARIAGHLAGEKFVGVMMDRSAALVAAVVGILKAGAAYVPIDKNYPVERIRDIVEDTGCSIVLTDGDVEMYVEGCSFIDVNAIGQNELPLHGPAPDDVAYVIYSSGTTGRPKGIMIQHSAILNLLHWYNERYKINEHTRIVQLTNIVVDIAFQEIFSALINGLTLYIPTGEEQQDRQLFIDFLNRHRINFIQLIPDMLSEYFLDIPKLEFLDQVLCGGDKLSEGLKDAIAAKGYTLYNIYGQTETAIDTVGAVCRQGVPMSFDEFVPNYRVYVLDEQGNLCPEYVAGEICTAGAGLGLGYVNQPALTAEKFIIHKGERIYKTGDMARRLPASPEESLAPPLKLRAASGRRPQGGSIQLLGRKDDQVKIRGFRIEPGEIESVLQRYPGISAAVVVARAVGDAEKQLVAYLAAKEALDMVSLRAYIGRLLPAYMMPGHFVQLDKLPLTAVGKVDRKRLPDPVGISLNGAAAYVPPRNETEQQLALMWQEILGKEKISVHDNFFESGGHSLKATRLASQIRKTFKVKISLKDLFVQPVLEEQARLIQQAKKGMELNIPVIPLSDGYELSSSQQRLWTLSQLEEVNVAYHIPAVFVMQGELNRTALATAFSLLLERHEILRTVFRENETGKAMQYVLPVAECGFGISYQDARNVEEHELKACVQQDFQRPFNLGHGPLMRACLYRVAENSWVFTYVMHHIISDGWSMDVLIKELLALYSEGTAAVLQTLGIQYKDFAAWQRAQLRGDALQQQKNYWLQQMEGELPVLDLSTDKPRPAVKTYNGGIVKRIFSPALSAALKQFNQQRGSTLFMSLLAGVNALLHRYTGQEDIIIGSPIAGREHAELENQVGFYINTLALRTRFSGTDSFSRLVEQVKAVALGAYDHQLYPFDALVEDLGVQRDVSRSALFDVMVVLQDTPQDVQEVKGISLSRYEGLEHKTSKFDLLFNFNEDLQLSIEYNTDLFFAETIERMAAHLEQLLNAAVANQAKLIGELEYLSSAEQYELLVSFNDTDADHPKDKTLVHLFQEQVQKTPERVAVVFESRLVKYHELNEQANRLASYLRQQYRIRPNDLVGVKLERSERMVITLLAVLKAGGAYVPIDPAYPAERIAYMVHDSRCKVLIDEEEYQRFKAVQYNYSAENPVIINKPGDLAYVIYTSGTTGNPKGSLVEHRNVVRLFINDSALFDFSATDAWTMFHSFCFDFSVWEMYGALLFGGKVVVISSMVARDPAAYLDVLEKEGVTVLNQTPSSFYNIASEALKRAESRLRLRYVIFGGEALSPGKLKEWNQRYPQVKLINMYGITETTVHVTYKEITQKEISSNISNIGRPIPTLRCYVLDKQQQLVPVGVPGELYVGGAGVARGYLNRDELTAQRFIASPFIEGDRLYRSGDKVKLLPNGEMEYQGRLDEQVKIRGHRIELGEIQDALQRFEGVDSSVVIARDAQHGGKELAAYVTPKNPNAIDITALRAWLGGVLPAYMVPAYFVVLESMPLTANGKIDRKNLPAPDVAGQINDNYAAPGNEMQEMLVGVWKEVLGLQKIGIHDNFFAIGGNSISSIEVISKSRRRGIELSARQMFQHPTVAELSVLAKRGNRHVASQEPVTGEMELLPVQRWYFENQTQDVHHFNYAIFIETPAVESPEGVITTLVQKHDALRLTFIERKGVFGANPVLEVHDCTNLTVEERTAFANAAAEEAQRSFSITEGPLMRAIWFNYGGEGRLLFIVHHLVVDGVSWRILLEDINTLFRQLANGEQLNISPKTNSYKDWSLKLHEYASSEQLLRERGYWTGVLKSVTKPFPVVQKDRSIQHQHKVVMELDEWLTNQLVQQANKAYNTQINDLLLSALAMAVCNWAGVDEFLVNLEGHGREPIFDDMDVSQTVGWFTTIFPVALRNNEMRQLIKGVKENLRGIPNNGIGYGALRYIIRDIAVIHNEKKNPAQVLFNYLGDFKTAKNNVIERTGTTISPKHRSLYALEFNGGVLNEVLKFNISYNDGEYSKEKMEQLAVAFKASLQQVIAHCVSASKVSFTHSDFPVAKLSQQKLDKLEAAFPALQEVYPATSMQKAMFFHSQVSERPGAYVVQQHGGLQNADPQRFVEAWQQLVHRHAVLRTAFTPCDTNGLLQIVNRDAALHYSYIDLRGQSKAAQSEQIKQLVSSDAYTDFDFEKAPLFRISLIHLEGNDFYVILSFHHIILDGWSMPILFSEFGQLYNSVKLPAVPQYGKYVQWLFKQDNEKSKKFWQQQLKGISNATKLSKAKTETVGHKELPATLSLQDSLQLKQQAANLGITLNSMLVAGWSLVLHQFTQEKQVLFGMTVSGRSGGFEGIESMVGLFINSIPVAVTLNEHEKITEWLKYIHQSQLESAMHSHLSLSEIQQQSAVPADEPMFESLLVHENYPVPSLDTAGKGHGLNFTNVQFKDENNAPLSLIVFSRNEISFIISYQLAMFHGAFIDELMAAFCNVMIELGRIKADDEIKTLFN
jgi:amino acid adenylation domain-containing protein/non-ribosomal peptide synthase protein (TIGR01720 family)